MTARGAAGPARLWAAPLWAHTLALAVVLVLGLVVIGPHVAFSSDEGVAVIQARMLRDGQGWVYRYPLARIDPEGDARPFEHGDVGSKGVAPYAKHPLYPLVLAGLDAVGGLGAMLVVGLAGTVVAALLAALLARRLDPRLDRVTLWAVGVGSPLFFDAYVVLAHTLAAAAAAAAALAAATILTPGTATARRAWCLVAMVAAAVLAAMLRTEALFLGPALAVAVAGLAVAHRIPWRRAVIVAGAGVGASAAAWAADHVAARHILGTSLPAAANSGGIGGLAGRWQAFHTTVLLASYSGTTVGDLLLEIGAAAIFAGAVVLHWRGGRPRWVTTGLTVGLACYVAHLLVGSGGPVPGLVLAFPLGWFLVWVASRRIGQGVVAPLLVVGSALVVVAVLATEYSIGGGVEWGGRYFSVVIPLVVPALLVAAEPVVRGRGADLGRLVVGLVAAIAVTSSLMALQGLRHWHQDTATVLDQIHQQAAVAGTSGGLSRPVVLTSNRLLPQIDYRDFGDYDWVSVDPSDLGRYADRLSRLGVSRLVLASTDQAGDLRHLPGWRVVRPAPGPAAVDVTVLERDPG